MNHMNVIARRVSERNVVGPGKWSCLLECGHKAVHIQRGSASRLRRTMPCVRCHAILTRRIAQGDRQADIARTLKTSRALIHKWALRISKGEA